MPTQQLRWEKDTDGWEDNGLCILIGCLPCYVSGAGSSNRFQRVFSLVMFKCVPFKRGRLLTGGVCVSVPLLASRLRMLLSDICRRAAMGGTLDKVAGSLVTSAFMSLSSSSNWFNTVMQWQNTLLCFCSGIYFLLSRHFSLLDTLLVKTKQFVFVSSKVGQTAITRCT